MYLFVFVSAYGPEPPEYEARDISVRVMSPQSVLISWIDPAVEMGKVEPAATASRSYTVKYREKGESARWEYKDSTQRRMMIDSLSADGMYEFSVRISQGENHGKWSVSVFQRTPESAPSGPPENFEVKPLRGKGTAVIATWDEPEEPNGRIREYILSYAPAMKPFGMKTVTYRGSITSATIDGLTPGDRYIFKIRATNRRGQGPQSKAFSVAMPGSSRGASSFSKNTDSSRSSQTPSKQDTDHEESDLELTEVPTEPTTTTPRPPSHPVNRRVRPLSQSRSYHSIFSSVRGSVRNGGGRSSFRDREKDKEEEEEEKPPPTTPPTTPAPVEETTTMEVIIEAKEPDNDVSPEFDEEEFRPLTTETPSLKVVTPSPTKPASRPKPPPRRPVKIRIHQRPGSKTSSDSSSSASSNPSTSSDSSSSSNPSTSSGSSSSNPSMSSGSSSSSNPSRSSGSSSSSNPSSSSGSSFSSNPSSSSGSSSSSNPSTSSHSSSSNPSTSSGSSSSSNPSTSSHSSSSSNPSSSSRSSSSSNPSTSSRSSSSFNPSSSSGSSSSSNPSTSSSSSSSSSSSTNPSSSSRIQESAAKRIDYTASTYPESKNTYDTLGTTHNKPVLETNATSVGRGSGTAGRLGGSRNGYGRRNSGILFRGNSTRNGYKPGSTSAGTSHLNFPSRSQNHATANTHSSATTSQSTYPSRTQNHETSNIFNSATSRSTSADGSNSQVTSDAHLDKSQSGSQSHATSNTHSSDTDPFTSQSSSKHPSTINTSGSSQSTSHRGSHIPVTSENTQNSHTSPGQDTVYKEGNDGSNYKETDTEESKAESTSSSQPSESERREESRSEKPAAPSRTRISSSLVERYPWLATRYPGRFGPGSRASSSRPEGRTPVTRTSSSMGASRPILRGTPTRVSGATGATGLSTIQETNEDSKPLSTDDSLKNGVGAESLKPSLTNQNVASTVPILKSDSEIVMKGSMTVLNLRGNRAYPNIRSIRVSVKFVHIFLSLQLVDLQRGVLMNSEGQILQDSQGKPKRVVLGEDGRTIFDHMGSPLVSQDGVALFGHGRDSRPVVNPKDKVIMVGGKPVLGLDLPRRRTTTTTTWAPTTTTELTTPDWYLEESTTAMPFPTCPPGTYSKIDEYGYPVLDPEGILDCYPEGDSLTRVLFLDEFLLQTTLPPPTTTTTTTTTSEIQTTDPVTGPFSKGPSSEFDLSGKKRFTAPYVNYIQKDPSAPCSLTEALEYLQVDVLENLMEKDSLAANQSQPPKNKPHNLTVVAMEGCHSFIILDWGRPIKDDMVSGYMVYSASYDDVLNNRWSSKTSSGTHLAVENLKPNSRYYFKVQAKNVFGLGPVSDMLTYVTESGVYPVNACGEPIWIPFTFKYNPIHSSCKGSQYVKRTWYRKFVGVVLCNSLRYKIFMGDGLREPFYSIGDTFGQGEDHCQFVDSYRDGRTGPAYLSNNLPSAQGYYRAYRQEPVSFGVIGRRTPHPFVGWYECGVPIPGKW
uniref:Fibronectin type III domain containing 1 n=1 Tax=Sphaeramia orbicularis TaxID=375764 RepID=A0A672YWY0_9TELE